MRGTLVLSLLLIDLQLSVSWMFSHPVKLCTKVHARSRRPRSVLAPLWATINPNEKVASASVETAAEREARRASLVAAQKALMAPLLQQPSERFGAFLKTLDSFMMDYALSSFEAGYSSEEFTRIIGSLLKNVGANMKKPFEFPPFHRAMREPFDYYRWAQSFMNTLILWEKSRTEVYPFRLYHAPVGILCWLSLSLSCRSPLLVSLSLF